MSIYNEFIEELSRIHGMSLEQTLQLIDSHNGIPKTTLNKLSYSNNAHTRYEVASNPNTSYHTLIRLADDPESDVRHGIAIRKDTPVNILEKLSDDVDPDVRMAVLYNRNATQEIIDHIILMNSVRRIHKL